MQLQAMGASFLGSWGRGSPSSWPSPFPQWDWQQIDIWLNWPHTYKYACFGYGTGCLHVLGSFSPLLRHRVPKMFLSITKICSVGAFPASTSHLDKSTLSLLWRELPPLPLEVVVWVGWYHCPHSTVSLSYSLSERFKGATIQCEPVRTCPEFLLKILGRGYLSKMGLDSW